MESKKIFTICAVAVLLFSAYALYVIDTMTVRGAIVMIGFSVTFFLLGVAWGKSTLYSISPNKEYTYWGRAGELIFLQDDYEDIHSAYSLSDQLSSSPFEPNYSEANDIVVQKIQRFRVYKATVLNGARLRLGQKCIGLANNQIKGKKNK